MDTIMSLPPEAEGQSVPLTVLLLPCGRTPADVESALEKNGDVSWYVAPAVAEGGGFQPGTSDDEVRVHGALRRAPSSPQPWRRLVTGFGMPLEESARERNEGAVILVRVAAPTDATGGTEDVHVAFCFGPVSAAIPRKITDSRFGLLTALNRKVAGSAVPPWGEVTETARRRAERSRVRVDDAADEVHNASVRAYGGYPHRLTAAATSGIPVTGLRLDVESDHMLSVTVHTDDPLMTKLEGGRGLRLSTPIGSLMHLVTLAEYLVMLRCRNDYRANWDWIDQIVEVPAGPEYDRVLDALVASIGTPQEPHIDLAIPALAGLTHRAERVEAWLSGDWRNVWTQPVWAHLRDRLVYRYHGDELERKLRTGSVRLAPEGNHSAAESFPLIDLLQTQLDLDGHHYQLDGGAIYRVDPTYLAAMDTALANVPASPFPFPVYANDRPSENDYLTSVATATGGRIAVLDTSQIRLPGQTAFEPCDIVTDDGRLVFGKLKGRSSHLNHLGPQAVTAVLALREPRTRTAFLERVDQAIAKQTAGNIPVRSGIAKVAAERMDHYGRRLPQALTVCLLIVGTWKGTPDVRHLPLLARVGLRSAVRDLERIGCQVELALVGTPTATTRSPGAAVPHPPSQRRPTGKMAARASAPSQSRSTPDSTESRPS